MTSIGFNDSMLWHHHWYSHITHLPASHKLKSCALVMMLWHGNSFRITGPSMFTLMFSLYVRKEQQLQDKWQKMGTPVLYWYKYIEIRLLRLEPLITVRIYIFWWYETKVIYHPWYYYIYMVNSICCSDFCTRFRPPLSINFYHITAQWSRCFWYKTTRNRQICIHWRHLRIVQKVVQLPIPPDIPLAGGQNSY